MRTRRLTMAALVVGGLALGACGSDGEGPDVSVPTSVTLPDRSTTVPSEPDATDPPTTDTPTTDTPTTETPTTDTPRTTEPPTTEEETEAETETETETAEAPPATGLEDTADDTNQWWPWLLALAVIGLIVFLVSRRSGKTAAWQKQVATALDASSRLATHLAAVAPEGAAMVATQDAGQLADLAATLSALGGTASNEAQRRAISSVHDQVQVLHGVVDGIAMGPGHASPAALDYLREQAIALHGATARARAEVLPSTPGHAPA
jgi:hypothetical protein